MKLLKLEMLNLASLDRPDGEVINFEEGALKDSTIFSIVGSTGSGKSTILDAICLALYNRAPRYPLKKGDRYQKFEIYGEADDKEKNRLAPSDCRNILTQGRKFGYSKLTFLANNGTVYRAEWSVRFKIKEYDPAHTALYSITDVNGVTVENVEDWASLPIIIGLDYDQFLRTVLIAQGTFSDFLNADEDERYPLLEKLIGADVLYSRIVDAIKKKQSDVNDYYKTIAASVAAFESQLIPEAELTQVEERIKELESEETADNEEKKCIAEALSWYKKEQDFVTNIGQYEKDYRLIQSKLAANKAAAERLQLHDTTLLAVELYRDIQGAKADIKSSDASLKALNEQRDIAKSDLEVKVAGHKDLQEREQKAKDERQKQKPHIDRARILMGELAALKKTAVGMEEAVTKAKKDFISASNAVKENAKAVAVLNDGVQEKQTILNDLKTAVQVQTTTLTERLDDSKKKFDHENKKMEGLDLDKLQGDKSAADKVLSDLKEALRITGDLQQKRKQSAVKQKELEDLQNRNVCIDKELASLTITSLSEELNVIKKSHTLMTSENWAMHRKDLSEGDSCPLCGSTHHPYATDSNLEPIITELDSLIKTKETMLQEQETLKSQLDKEKGTNNGKIEASRDTLSNLAKVLNDLEEKWTVLVEQRVDWQQDVEMLSAEIRVAQGCCEKAGLALDDYNRLSRIVNEARAEVDRARDLLDKYKETSSKDLNAAQKAVNDVNTLYQAECAKTEQLAAQLKGREEDLMKAEESLELGKIQVKAKEYALKSEIGDKDPVKFEDELEQEVMNATAEVEKMLNGIGKLRETMREIDGKIHVEAGNGTKAKEKLDTRTQELNAWLGQYNAQEEVVPLSVEDIAAFYSSTENWEYIRRAQKQLDAEYTRRHTTLENEKSAHQTHQQTKPKKSEEELTARQADLDSKNNDELTKARDRMRMHNHAKAQMGMLYNDAEQARQAKSDWDQIGASIGKDGKSLRKIAQCYTLRFLVEHANAEIRKFNSRYELVQVKNSLGIRIIDHDRADDVRDTTSLSGGETFIVSLGLALGLSSLSSRNIAFENLFIDEGFGTLDPDTLSTVIDSLATLQSSQGKKVGVISHTDTMSERITTQIRIIKNGDSGSSRIEIYP